MIDKKPVDENGKRHGMWEIYRNGILINKGLYIHGHQYGRHVMYDENGKFLGECNAIRTTRHAYQEYHWSSGIVEKIFYAY